MKKTLLILLALMLAFTFVSCGNSLKAPVKATVTDKAYTDLVKVTPVTAQEAVGTEGTDGYKPAVEEVKEVKVKSVFEVKDIKTLLADMAKELKASDVEAVKAKVIKEIKGTYGSVETAVVLNDKTKLEEGKAVTVSTVTFEAAAAE